ncbi:large ribosomal subunit protein uL23m [Parasteatoda tepidariorum]|uniref:Large ribosomal subunit protein uL23m n=1 Tax=Parasteatoda tepidariorum TaxID=114398 RepID=A0A2L2YG27_PARTP|nr:probable 39S ribosomal protein L23, mitochondrial [Parasteatoda tepidariorum]
MSSRVYPQFIKGNPKLRIFLPNFTMKLIKPKMAIPENQVHFIIPLAMTGHDCKNYLQQIYKVNVAQVHTKIITGDLKRTHKNYIIKDPDYKLAIVSLPHGQVFKFPDLFPKEKQEKKDKDQQRLMDQAEGLVKQRERNSDRMDVPSWF